MGSQYSPEQNRAWFMGAGRMTHENAVAFLEFGDALMQDETLTDSQKVEKLKAKKAELESSAQKKGLG